MLPYLTYAGDGTQDLSQARRARPPRATPKATVLSMPAPLLGKSTVRSEGRIMAVQPPGHGVC